jgi:hypothetical protein
MQMVIVASFCNRTNVTNAYSDEELIVATLFPALDGIPFLKKGKPSSILGRKKI